MTEKQQPLFRYADEGHIRAADGYIEELRKRGELKEKPIKVKGKTFYIPDLGD